MIHQSQQRTPQVRPAASRRAVAVAFAAAWVAHAAAVHAQAAPPPPVPATVAGSAIEVQSFAVRGVTRFGNDEIDAVLRPYAGRALTPAQINEAAAALTAYYRQAGYFVAQVFVPPDKPSRLAPPHSGCVENR